MNFLSAVLDHLSSLKEGSIRDISEIHILSRQDEITIFQKVVVRNNNELLCFLEWPFHLRINSVLVPADEEVLVVSFDDDDVTEFEGVCLGFHYLFDL